MLYAAIIGKKINSLSFCNAPHRILVITGKLIGHLAPQIAWTLAPILTLTARCLILANRSVGAAHQNCKTNLTNLTTNNQR